MEKQTQKTIASVKAIQVKGNKGWRIVYMDPGTDSYTEKIIWGGKTKNQAISEFNAL